MEEPVDQRLDDDRTAPGSQALGRPLHHQVHRERIHAVDLPGGDAEAEGAGGQPGLAGRFGHRRRDRVAVVLDEEAERQLPGRGQVHRLQDGADVDRAVAEVGDGQVGVGRRAAAGAVPLRPGVARGHRHAAADDRVGSEGAGLQPLQVHGAAAPGAVALGEPEDLRQGALQHLRHLGRHQAGQVEVALGDVGERLGQELMVAPVRAVDRVGRPERDDRADRAALLADGGVRGAVHQSLARQLEDGLLERPDQVELAEHGGQQRGVGRLPVRGRARQCGPVGAGRQALDARHSLSPSAYLATGSRTPGPTLARSGRPPRYPDNASISTVSRVRSDEKPLR